MLKFTRCDINSSDSLLDGTTGALIVTNGESPNATVAISVRNGNRFSRRDRLFDCSIKGRGKKWVFQGRSEQLESDIGLKGEDAIVTIDVIVHGHCENCGGS